MSMSDNAHQVLDWCDKYDYHAWYLKEKTQLTDPIQIPTRGRCHLLLLPIHVEFRSHLLNLEQSASLDKVRVS